MFSTVMSAFFNNSLTISSPRGDFRLSVSDFLLALNWWKYHGSLSGWPGRSRRPGSPVFGFSILTHLGAEPGQRLGAGRPGLELGEVDDAHARQTIDLHALYRHRPHSSRKESVHHYSASAAMREPIANRGRLGDSADGRQGRADMAVIGDIAESHDDLTEWRRDIHAHPELGFEEKRTSDLVAEKLADFGIEVHRGIGRTGVVGRLRVGNSPRSIGLRADMDALPIQEANQSSPTARSNAGRMHACGHDGHTTMLLGAARYLAETRNFDGTVHFIFQPAEEGLGGGAGDGRGRALRALPVRRDLRHAQPARARGRQIRDPRRRR